MNRELDRKLDRKLRLGLGGDYTVMVEVVDQKSCSEGRLSGH